DDVGFGIRIDELRKEGYKVFNGGSFTDKLEADRNYGSNYAKKIMDIKIPEIHEFNCFDDAKTFLEGKEKKYVLKFNGIAANQKEMLYISQFNDNKDMLSILDYYKTIWRDEWGESNFVLQEKIEGIEIGISAYFNGKNFVKPFYLDMEYKHFLAGDTSIYTGQEGESQLYTKKKTKLFDKTLKHLEDDLREVNYVGYVNVNGIINDDDLYFLEFTISRFGYNSVSLEIENIKSTMRFTDFIIGLFDGKDDFNILLQHAVGTLIHVPPYPYEQNYEFLGKGLPVFFEFEDESQFHPHNVKYDVESKKWITAGDTGYICSVVGTGETAEDAIKDMKDKIKQVVIPKMGYRNDIGLRWNRQSPLLRKLGYV
ncbi:MAG: hypothetical protein ACOYWZ_15670, partial [Bacillota bacterium]